MNNDDLSNKGVGTWAYELRQRLDLALNGTEKIIIRLESKDKAR